MSGVISKGVQQRRLVRGVSLRKVSLSLGGGVWVGLDDLLGPLLRLGAVVKSLSNFLLFDRVPVLIFVLNNNFFVFADVSSGDVQERRMLLAGLYY